MFSYQYDVSYYLQESIVDWDMPENTELKDYGRLLKDGELRIRAHDDQKIKVRYVYESFSLAQFSLSLVCFKFLWLHLACGSDLKQFRLS
jgi:hypothetical protein